MKIGLSILKREGQKCVCVCVVYVCLWGVSMYESGCVTLKAFERLSVCVCVRACMSVCVCVCDIVTLECTLAV